MDARVISKATDFRRRQTVLAERCMRSSLRGSSSAPAVFKKSRNAADLQRPGRDVAKDRDETGTIASLTKSLDQSDRSEAAFTANGRISAESLLAVLGTSHLRRIFARRTARQPSAAVDGAIGGAANCNHPININLTAVAGTWHPTAPMLRQTNISSGSLCKAARRVQSTIVGVMTQFGVSHEKYGYAGV